MGNIVNLLIQLVGGGLGGIAAGKLFPKLSLGNIGNILAGIIGGIGGGQLLPALGISISSGALDLGSIFTNVLAGGLGGGILMALISLVKKLFKK